MTSPESPQLDAVAWIALGMAIANRTFARQLLDQVGSRAFQLDEVMDQVYSLVEAAVAMDQPGKLPDHQRLALAKTLKVPIINGEKLSTAILRLLSHEDESAWTNRDNELMKLAKFVELSTNRIKRIAYRPVIKEKP